MRWLIMTPDETVGWDGNQLAFGPGVSSDKAAAFESYNDEDCLNDHDPFESLWKTYYAHIFNPHASS